MNLYIYSAVKATARNILPLNVIQYKIKLHPNYTKRCCWNDIEFKATQRIKFQK